MNATVDQILENIENDLCEFLGFTSDVFQYHKEHLRENHTRDWKMKKSIEDYYSNSFYILFDLIKWYQDGTRTSIEKMLDVVRKDCQNKDVKYALDFGSGMGIDAMRLCESGFQVFAYDIGISQKFAEFLVNKYKYPIVFVDWEDMPGIEFDVVFAIEVLEHLVDPISTVKQLKNIMSKEAIFVEYASFEYPNGITFEYLLSMDEPHPHLRRNHKLMSTWSQTLMELGFNRMDTHIYRVKDEISIN